MKYNKIYNTQEWIHKLVRENQYLWCIRAWRWLWFMMARWVTKWNFPSETLFMFKQSLNLNTEAHKASTWKSPLFYPTKNFSLLLSVLAIFLFSFSKTITWKYKEREKKQENLKCCGGEVYKEGRNEESENEMNLY